ncbi:hypothetical protein Q1695_010484 [Nippostrongylus brasiliensis]|nr:hypothetical protein Q1695_010484 [Nippostrongylus brasiliensis]
MILLFILLLVDTVDAAAPNCNVGGTLTSGQRDVLLNQHNTVRRKTARGRADNYDLTKLPGASNMYELTYDCNLEKVAVDRNALCTEELMSPIKYGENVQTYVANGFTALSLGDQLRDAVPQWYYPVMYWGQRDAANNFADPRLQTFANLVNYRNSKVGCDVKTCNGRSIVRCIYDQYIVPGSLIYPIGTACNADADCTTVAGSTCVNFLCNLPANTPSLGITQPTTQAPVTPMCANTDMTDEMRTTILNAHNDYRSETAQGITQNGQSGEWLPKAADMRKLKYDCTLESAAITAAKTCSLQRSANVPANQEENFYVSAVDFHETVILEIAAQDWYQTIVSHGINKVVHYRDALDKKPTAPKPYIRMVWSNTTSVGCAFQYCSGNAKFVVCRYSPRSLIVGDFIYEKGAPCGKCPNSCSQAEGLCL